MDHKIFRVLLIVCLAINLPIIFTFDYLLLKFDNENIILKLFPVSLMLITTMIYMKIYRPTIYSGMTFFALLFCLIGDLYLSFNGNFYIIIGGISFFVARLILLVNYMVKPYRKFHIIKYKAKTLLVSHTLFSLPFISIGAFFIIYLENVFSYLLCAYFVLGCGLQMSYAFLRINGDESKVSTIVSFVGMSLFNVSDVFLLLALFTNLLPKYWTVIADNIYWVSMYLLTLSVVRNSSEYIENGAI